MVQLTNGELMDYRCDREIKKKKKKKNKEILGNGKRAALKRRKENSGAVRKEQRQVDRELTLELRSGVGPGCLVKS